VETEFGPFRMCWYEDHVYRTVHAALIRGDITGKVPPLVRVHLKDTLRDVIGVRGEAGGWTLRGVMQRIAAEGNGVVIILRQLESARDIMASVAALDAAPGPAAGGQAEGGTVLRTYGIGAQILQDLGVTRMRVLSSPKQMLGISAFGLEVTGYVD
jgi:3,4-dihydroxy 2-butanone 4-phosphate synthase/GTP cyclohydrolase II